MYFPSPGNYALYMYLQEVYNEIDGAIVFKDSIFQRRKCPLL